MTLRRRASTLSAPTQSLVGVARESSRPSFVMDLVVITHTRDRLVRARARLLVGHPRVFRRNASRAESRLVIIDSHPSSSARPASRRARRDARLVEMSVTTPTPPPLTFQTFLEKMRQPSASALVRDVKTFIASRR